MKRSTIRGTPGFAPLLLLRHPNAIKRYCLSLSGFLVSETLHSGLVELKGLQLRSSIASVALWLCQRTYYYSCE